MVAPVDLPDGAELSGVTAWVIDNQAGSDFAVELFRKRRGNSVPAQSLSLLLTSGANPGLQTLVDNALGTFIVPKASGFIPPCGIAPLELPLGAALTGFLANLYDSRADRGLTLELLRSPINSMVVPTVLASTSTAATTGLQLRSDLSVTDPVVDNDSFWYHFRLCVTGGNNVAAGELGAQAIQVLYTLP